MPDHEVVIVGAGPVGLMLACLLAQQGRDVVVCERRTEADTRTRAIGIHRPGLDALDAAGIGDRVRAEALVLDGGEVRSRRRVLASVDFAADRPVLTLPQTRTDSLLRDRLSTLAPDALLAGDSVRGVHGEDSHARLRIEGRGGHREITAELVVAADGVRSPIRSRLGIGWRRRPGAAAYAMADVVDPDLGRRAVLHCEPAGLVESFPLPGGRRRWVLRVDGLGVTQLTGEAFSAEIERRTGIRPSVVDPPTHFDASQHRADAFVRGRVVLLGDAAREVSPIGGQGMNLGWTDAVALADAIARGGEGRPRLGGWEAAARRSARRAQDRSAFYMAMGAPSRGMSLRGRDVVIRALGSAPARAWTAGLLTMRGI